MTDEHTLYLSQVLLASAFYYGVAGGLVGWCIVPAARAAYRLFRRATQWR